MTGSTLLLFKKKKSRRAVDYNFASGSLPSGVTLARASSGTRFNASGVMVSEAANVPRFDYDPVTLALSGLCVEPQRTNRALYSVMNSSGTGWVFTYSQRYTPALTAPDGTDTMMGVGDQVNTDAHAINVNYWPWHYLNEKNTVSYFAKAGTLTVIQTHFSNTIYGANTYANFDLSNGTVSAFNNVTARITPCGNGVFLCSATATVIAEGTTPVVSIAFTNNDPLATRTPSYLGTGKYCYIWGVQAEIGATRSAYIPTSGDSATRAADVVQFTIPSGVATLRYTFDDNSTQDVAVSAGAYTVPTNLNRAWIKRIQSV